ncbi:hypothetical protein P152DRAFT_404563 [Eremomyces bilateralis CBS 781.70]|uniref:Glycosyltransferase family 25 protein n=1 Tax=Eremomyces bilateralis CBS 781.70 TaxID=1392243 RepID=A0A6G1FSW7_9PEZI|nr:uncharacterized protein P152DRAFT_404563 [Eremomyces bilateralis CBS 781.70]KAF1808864.1 hypothetical protein P152DRAFT_404563 [Eremomyces bilateralis CBS 781.70]
MLAQWKRHFLVVAAFILIYYCVFRDTLNSSYHGLISSFSSLGPANSTLGFGAVYVVSGLNSPRRFGLVQAANVTGIDLTIPTQPIWTDHDERKFYEDGFGNITTTTGSIRAWLAHDSVLQEFIDSGHETALILEDDVDWDIRLRTMQIPRAAAAIRSYSDRFAPNPRLSPRRPRAASSYYGDTSAWDLLYIGHCGDYFDAVEQYGVDRTISPSELATTNHTFYADATLIPRSDLHPFTAQLFNELHITEHIRMVHQSVWPLCTFGYAVTRAAAIKIHARVAPPKATHEAFDVAMLHACRAGAADGLRCVTVNPELFHHMEGESIISQQNPDPMGIPPVDFAGLEQTMERGETSNIGCGFWSGDFDFDEDFERLGYLRKEVAGKGRCLKPGRG